MKPIRFMKDGYPVYKEWYEYEKYSYLENDKGEIVDAVGIGKKRHMVLTDCSRCSVNLIGIWISDLVRGRNTRCDGCIAYDQRY